MISSLFALFLLTAVQVSLPPQNRQRSSSNLTAELNVEVADQILSVSGQIPLWLNGTLIRNGPVNIAIDGKTNSHWFDGLAMLHSFDFENGTVRYTNRFLRTDAYRTAFEDHTLNYGGFAQNVQASVKPISVSEPSLRNANVNVAILGGHYVALTETPLPVKFDRMTLHTLGTLDYQDDLPKSRCWESAHPHRDASRKETLNYLVQYGNPSYYILYRLADHSLQRDTVAKIPVEKPAYMHSFAVTKNYVIFTEFPLIVDPRDLLTSGKPFICHFKWEPQRGTRLIVIDRADGKLIGTYFTESFFSFHHVNAFEEEDRIHLDIVCYQNANVIQGIANHFKESSCQIYKPFFPSFLKRFTVTLSNGDITAKTLSDKTCEFPRINEQFEGRPYRYLYSMGSDQKKERHHLYKIDTQTKSVLQWSENNCHPGEPVFVPMPGNREEDQGVVLSLIKDVAKHSSFLLILDAKTFKELARATTPFLIPDGLHAQFFGS